jgi:hypothetical protein
MEDQPGQYRPAAMQVSAHSIPGRIALEWPCVLPEDCWLAIAAEQGVTDSADTCNIYRRERAAKAAFKSTPNLLRVWTVPVGRKRGAWRQHGYLLRARRANKYYAVNTLRNTGRRRDRDGGTPHDLACR